MAGPKDVDPAQRNHLSRREFLRLAALVVAGGTLASCNLPTSTAEITQPPFTPKPAELGIDNITEYLDSVFRDIVKETGGHLVAIDKIRKDFYPLLVNTFPAYDIESELQVYERDKYWEEWRKLTDYERPDLLWVPSLSVNGLGKEAVAIRVPYGGLETAKVSDVVTWSLAIDTYQQDVSYMLDTSYYTMFFGSDKVSQAGFGLFTEVDHKGYFNFSKAASAAFLDFAKLGYTANDIPGANLDYRDRVFVSMLLQKEGMKVGDAQKIFKHADGELLIEKLYGLEAGRLFGYNEILAGAQLYLDALTRNILLDRSYTPEQAVKDFHDALEQSNSPKANFKYNHEMVFNTFSENQKNVLRQTI